MVELGRYRQVRELEDRKLDATAGRLTPKSKLLTTILTVSDSKGKTNGQHNELKPPHSLLSGHRESKNFKRK